jgi:hypothetical protein
MRRLKYLTLDDFKGLNYKSDPSDMVENQAQTLQNLDITQRFGRLSKRLGYELATDILGTNYTAANKLVDYDGTEGTITTIYSVYEWQTGRASPNDKVYVIHANDGSEERIYYWDNLNSRWQQLDDNTDIGTYDKARFHLRNDSLIIASGIGATDYPVFIKYYEARTICGAEVQAAGYYDYRNQLQWDSNFSLDTTRHLGAGDLLKDKAYIYYAALTYDDGSSIGSVSGVLDTNYNTTNNNDLALKVDIIISTANAANIERRVSHINIYRGYSLNAKEFAYHTGGGVGGIVYKITKEYSSWINSRYMTTVPLVNTDVSMPVYEVSEVTVDQGAGTATDKNKTTHIADKWINLFLKLTPIAGGSTTYHKITDNGTSIFTIDSAPANGDYYSEIVPQWYTDGSDYKIRVLDDVFELPLSITDIRNHGHQTLPNINYKYAITVNNRMFVAPLYLVDDSETHKNWIGASIIDGLGNYSYDVITTFINLQDYGVAEIKGLGRLSDFLIIFTDNDIFKLNVASGSEFNWSLEDNLQNVGVISEDSITYIASDEFKYSGYYYLSRDGVRVYDGYKSWHISLQIEDTTNYPLGSVTLSEAIGGYNDRNKQYILSFPTENIVYIFDLRSGEWLKLSGNAAIKESTITVDGEYLATDATSIYVHDNDGTNNLTDYAGSNIVPIWKSKIHDFGSPGIQKILHEVTIRYYSNTAIRFRWYKDKSGTATDINNPSTSFPSNSGMTSVTIGFPAGSRCYEAEFEIYLDSSDQGDNTIFEIDRLEIGYTLKHSERI